MARCAVAVIRVRSLATRVSHPPEDLNQTRSVDVTRKMICINGTDVRTTWTIVRLWKKTFLVKCAKVFQSICRVQKDCHAPECGEHNLHDKIDKKI